MGDDMDFGYTPSCNTGKCPEAITVRDCDGDFFTRCVSSHDCPYKRSIRDCDGDWFSVCDK